MNENFEKNDAKKESLEREKRSRVFSRFLRFAENIEPLHGRTVSEVFSDENEKRAFIESVTLDDFFELLDGVNGILRNKKKEEWNMDGEWVALIGILLGVDYLPPLQIDKPELLTKVLVAAKEMNREGRDMKDIAMLVSSGLNAIHPYADANGRTSRFIYLILTKGLHSETESELSEASDSFFAREKSLTNPGIVRGAIQEIAEKEITSKGVEIGGMPVTNLFGYEKDIHFSDKIKEEDKNLFSKLLDCDTHNLFLGVLEYLQTQKDKESYVRIFPNRAAVLVETLSKRVTPEGLTQILQNYRNLKKRDVEVLIDIIRHPEKEIYQIEYEGERMSLKQYWEQY